MLSYRLHANNLNFTPITYHYNCMRQDLISWHCSQQSSRRHCRLTVNYNNYQRICNTAGILYLERRGINMLAHINVLYRICRMNNGCMISDRGVGTGGTQGTCTPTHNQGGNVTCTCTPIVMKLIDCFGLLCNLSFIILYLSLIHISEPTRPY